jgi:hypothetical protein
VETTHTCRCKPRASFAQVVFWVALRYSVFGFDFRRWCRGVLAAFVPYVVTLDYTLWETVCDGTTELSRVG